MTVEVANEAQVLEAIQFICEKLTEQKAVLFLGAGINAETQNESGEKFPLGNDLSRAICRDLLGEPGLSASLEEAAEYAEYKVTREGLNDYIYKWFSTFKPGIAHLALVQLPWDAIYTTNYDTLVENAADSSQVRPAGNITPVHSQFKEVSSLSEADIPYYKLHGNIDFANKEDGRLILTKEDYRHYELFRKPLFKRLEQDLSNKTFVFIGYSLSDNNFKKILDDCRAQLGDKPFPVSYAIVHDAKNVQKVFWKEKYNIEFIPYDGAQFLNQLRDSWNIQNLSVIPLQERLAKQYFQVDGTARFPRVGDSFYQIRAIDCSGQSNPSLFFRGAEPTWADIREKIAPERDAYWQLFEALLDDDPTAKVRTYIVTGAAGTGKTTLIYTLAFELAQSNYSVLIHIPGTPLDSRLVEPLIDKKSPKRTTIIIRNASEYLHEIRNFIDELNHKNLPVTLIMEERKNQWSYAVSTALRINTSAEIELGRLSGTEIRAILGALEKHNSLGKLTGTDSEYQISHFTKLADKELLVALRELTSEATFDRIVWDEYQKIPTDKAKKAYVFIAAAGILELAIRYETIINLLGITYRELKDEVFLPTEGVLISCEEIGNSRHNAGFRLRTRHPIIASVIFDSAAPDDQTKFDILNDLLSKLDPGHREDNIFLHEICRGEELINTFTTPEKKRAIFERLETILPNNAYVFQHRSNMERSIDCPEEAIKYARFAVDILPENHSFQNTLGFALELAARHSKADFERRALLTEAARIFEEGIKRYKSNPYNYLGLYAVKIQEINLEPSLEKKAILDAEALTMLESAFDATNGSDKIASRLAEQRKKFKPTKEVVSFLEAELKKSPTNTYLRDTLIRTEIENKNYKNALKLASDGAKEVPTHWRFQLQIARLLQRFDEPLESIKGHYAAAIRHNKADISLLIEYAAFLYRKNMLADAMLHFKMADALALPTVEKRLVRQHWKENDKLKVFEGIVSTTRGATGLITSIPDNYDIFFWRTHTAAYSLREGDKVNFCIGFNSKGPIAFKFYSA